MNGHRVSIRAAQATSILVLAAAPALAQVKLFTVNGDGAFDELGSDVARAGFVDGDNVPDWIVGAPRDASGGQQGYARVYSGANGSVLYTFHGALVNEQFGGSVSSAGDVDNDGRDDVVVGSRYETPSDANGRARVFSGRDGSVLHTFFGELDPNFRPQPVAGVGDVDGDGHDDVLVGEPFCSAGAPNGGRVRVYSGATGLVLREVTGALGEQLGTSAAAAGDVDADGVPDFVVGGRSNGVSIPGHLWVYSGATGGLLLGVAGASFTDQFGVAVDGAGDVDGDGYADVIVGAPSDATGGVGAGAARVYSGRTGALLWARYGSNVVRGLGLDVAGAGDLDGDGRAEFLATADSSGVGAGTGSATIYSGADGSLLHRMLSHVPNDQFGIAVATLGDVNGDGDADYVVGAYSGDVPNASAGSAYVLSLAPTYSTYCTATANSTGLAATIEGSGYGTISANDLVLHGARLPAGTTCMVIASTAQGSSTLGNGILCLSGSVRRTYPVATADGTGRVAMPIQLNASPWLYLVHPGDTWNLQLWFRDAAAGGARFNLSPALHVAFVP